MPTSCVFPGGFFHNVEKVDNGNIYKLVNKSLIAFMTLVTATECSRLFYHAKCACYLLTSTRLNNPIWLATLIMFKLNRMPDGIEFSTSGHDQHLVSSSGVLYVYLRDDVICQARRGTVIPVAIKT